jgi:hypothetical protein
MLKGAVVLGWTSIACQVLTWCKDTTKHCEPAGAGSTLCACKHVRCTFAACTCLMYHTMLSAVHPSTGPYAGGHLCAKHIVTPCLYWFLHSSPCMCVCAPSTCVTLLVLHRPQPAQPQLRPCRHGGCLRQREPNRHHHQ